ncbi:MAG: hypothetical protein JNL11_14340 [Bdellovibrionaceae bacterium]|nr:hypothetical protein [Pseudobdellovibrionaceae bacterium]
MIGDLFTVARYFLFSILFVGALQVEIKGKSLESHTTEWFYTSSVPQHIRTASKGGALLVENGVHTTKRFFNGLFGSSGVAGASR